MVWSLMIYGVGKELSACDRVVAAALFEGLLPRMHVLLMANTIWYPCRYFLCGLRQAEHD